jgi:putative ABC transport system permease protein
MYPILAAMHRNKVGAVLIGLQIAVTLAVLCNASFIIQQRLDEVARPSGTDEADLFAITNDWFSTGGNAAGRAGNDLAALRGIPGVVGAYVTNSYPLTNSGSSDSLSLEPDQPPAARTAVYAGDQEALQTLGLRLIAGRGFTAGDIVDRTAFNHPLPDGLIITQALARALFPTGQALGRRIYFESNTRTTPIIGVVARLQVPWVSAGFARAFIDNSTLVPYRYVADRSYYVVRAKPGRLADVMQAAAQRLMQTDPDRVIEKVQPFSAARALAYRDDRGLAVILVIVCAVLLIVMACSIVGLTSYWVTQRRRQIGIRRALGATRPAIVRYFQVENLLIAGAGVIVGVGLAVAASLWMVSRLAMPRLDERYLIAGAAILLALGQLAVLWPALRAASVPPAEATRAV